MHMCMQICMSVGHCVCFFVTAIVKFGRTTAHAEEPTRGQTSGYGCDNCSCRKIHPRSSQWCVFTRQCCACLRTKWRSSRLWKVSPSSGNLGEGCEALRLFCASTRKRDRPADSNCHPPGTYQPAGCRQARALFCEGHPSSSVSAFALPQR